MLFRKKKSIFIDVTEQKFQTIVELVKDLPKADYKRLVDAMDMAYRSYQIIKNVKTPDERENADIEESEKVLTKESE